MARAGAAAGRALAACAALVAVLVGLVALAGTWWPDAGSDLGDGTRVTLQVEDGEVPAGRLAEAAALVQERVGALDVAGAEVFTRGGDRIVLQVPGSPDAGVVTAVRRPGRLGIRMVACTTGVPGPCAQQDGQQDGQPEGAAGGAGASGQEPPAPRDVGSALVWSAQPPATWRQRFTEATCPATTPEDSAPGEPLVACDGQGVTYLLTPAIVDGGHVDGADAVQAATGAWQVRLDLDSEGTDRFAELSQALAPGNDRFAVVLDGSVVTAPTMQSVVADGNPSFSGEFDEQGARDLADRVALGALPVTFAAEPQVVATGPSVPVGTPLLVALVALAAALVAGLARYRWAALAGVASLLVAGLLTWSALALLSGPLDLVLGTPVLAALAVGVVLVADSFVTLAERLRAELRAGSSPRGALEAAWPRVRARRLACGGSVLLVAVAIGLAGTGGVRSSAVVLGIVAAVDAVVLLLLTHPLLARLLAMPPPPDGEPATGLPGRGPVWLAVSAAVALVALVGLAWPGPSLGPDLSGGTEVVVTSGERPTDAAVDEVRDGVASQGLGEADARRTGDGVVVRTDRLDGPARDRLAEAAGTAGEAEVADVGPTWRDGALLRAGLGVAGALVLSLLLLRARTGGWKPAASGLVAVAFDLLATTGLGVLLGLQVSTATVAGFLAVLALSVQDKVHVLDRVTEATTEQRRTRGSWTGAVAAAVAGSLGRSAATLAVLALPALAVVVTGLVQPGTGPFADLALVLLLGSLATAWSTLFLAVPLLVRLRAGEKDFRTQEARAAARRTRSERKPVATAAASRPAPPRANRQVRTSAAAKRAQPTRQSRAGRGRPDGRARGKPGGKRGKGRR